MIVNETVLVKYCGGSSLVGSLWHYGSLSKQFQGSDCSICGGSPGSLGKQLSYDMLKFAMSLPGRALFLVISYMSSECVLVLMVKCHGLDKKKQEF